jgi:hypothetical protein
MTDEEITAAMEKEITAARKILAEDGVHVRLNAIEARLAAAFPDPPDPSKGPVPPEPKDQPDPSQADKPRRGGWWPAGTFDDPAEPPK